MPFIDQILQYPSVSVTGLEKNTGKTTCLNYIMSRLQHSGKRIAVTSIGVDGEQADLLSGAPKPSITVYPGNIFVTSEKCYRQKRVDAEILDVSQRQTALGRLVTARALGRGQVMLAGPSDRSTLKQLCAQLSKYEPDLVITDGAFSRLSHGAPSVSGCMVLNTGAAVSADLNTLVVRTKLACNLMRLEKSDLPFLVTETLQQAHHGVYLVDNCSIEPVDLDSAHQVSTDFLGNAATIYVAGALTARLLALVAMQHAKISRTVIVHDFTRVFADAAALRMFFQAGHRLQVLQPANLVAVCFNPVSPGGFRMNSAIACAELSAALHLPVYDLKNLKHHETIFR